MIPAKSNNRAAAAFLGPAALLVLVSCWGTGTMAAGSSEPREVGTSALQLATPPLPQPDTVKVLVLPAFVNGDTSYARLATAAVWKRFEFEGFQLVDLKEGFEDWKADTLHEAGVPALTGDALRTAAAAGADWVVWENVESPKAARIGYDLSGELHVANVHTGQVFYTREHAEHDRGVPRDLVEQGRALPRRLLVRWSETALYALMSALPSHATSGKPLSDRALQEFYVLTWPPDARK